MTHHAVCRGLVEAVAAIITNPEDGVLTLRELHSKPELGKHTGMRSVPMETKKVGESDSQTLLRLRHEEAHGLNVMFDLTLYGTYWVTPWAVARLYRGVVLTKELPTRNGSREIDSHQWDQPGDVLSEWTRRGVSEMIKDYIAGRKGITRLYCQPVPCSPAFEIARE